MATSSGQGWRSLGAAAMVQWPSFPAGLPFRGPVCSLEPAQLSFHHSELSATRPSPSLHSLSEPIPRRSHMFPRPHLTAVAPGLAPRSVNVPFDGRWVFLPGKFTSFTCLFFMLSLILAWRAMPIPCTLDEGNQRRELESMGSFHFEQQ